MGLLLMKVDESMQREERSSTWAWRGDKNGAQVENALDDMSPSCNNIVPLCCCVD